MDSETTTENQTLAVSLPRLVRIRVGATVGRDHRYWEWPHLPDKPDPEKVFTQITGGEWPTLEAEGYGVKGAYGSGRAWAKADDLIDANGKDMP